MKNDDDDFEEVVYETEKFLSDEDKHTYVDDLDSIMPLQVVCCVFTIKKDEDDWQCTVIFHIYTKCGCKVWKVVIDDGSCMNMVAKNSPRPDEVDPWTIS